jgi:hypothetical protein
MYQYKQHLTAKEFADYDRNCTREHHLRRVHWLSSDAPTYACGTPVLKSDRNQMLESSNQYLIDGLWGARAIRELAPIPYRNDL